MQKSLGWAALGSAFLLAAGCAGIGADRTQIPVEDISTSMLLDASPLADGGKIEDYSQLDVLALTPEMKAFADERVGPHSGTRDRLRALTYAIMEEGTFEITYEEKTRTAAETFSARRGNCMSFTNLFVALARYAGINAYYQEVDVPPIWSLAGDSFVINQHINVFVDVGNDRTRVIDFNLDDFSADYSSRVVSDRRARAHYFNNLGAEAMLRGDTSQALGNFRQSLKEDGAFAAAWVNLGTLYRRNGFLDYAEAAYLESLRGDEFSLVAMSNLANLYRDTGRDELADAYGQRVRAHRNRNPYYHYLLATEAYSNGDYTGAIGHARRAIRLRDDEVRFYSLLSQSYLMNGDSSEALRWMEKVKSAAIEEQDRP